MLTTYTRRIVASLWLNSWSSIRLNWPKRKLTNNNTRHETSHILWWRWASNNNWIRRARRNAPRLFVTRFSYYMDKIQQMIGTQEIVCPRASAFIVFEMRCDNFGWNAFTTFSGEIKLYCVIDGIVVIIGVGTLELIFGDMWWWCWWRASHQYRFERDVIFQYQNKHQSSSITHEQTYFVCAINVSIYRMIWNCV